MKIVYPSAFLKHSTTTTPPPLPLPGPLPAAAIAALAASLANRSTRKVKPSTLPSSVHSNSTLSTTTITGGTISLVGAGTGSPDLLTIAALNAITQADVIICDKIASKDLKDLVPAHAQFFEADKIPGNADTAQAELNEWGISALLQGKRVVRLKAGDPFLYGRGGEEVQFYRRHGFEPDVIPGVTSALVGPLIAGIPVTHRGAANQLLISTGQGRGGSFPDLPHYDKNRTVVLLMAVGRIPFLYDDLVNGGGSVVGADGGSRSTGRGRGYPASTPVAIIEKATHPEERVIKTTLQRLREDAQAAGVTSPAILVLGGVVDCLDQEEEENTSLGGGGDTTSAGHRAKRALLLPVVDAISHSVAVTTVDTE